MKPDKPNFRPGNNVPDHPPFPLILNRKNIKKYNILVGHDRAQIQFAHDFLGLPVVALDKIDDMVLLSEGDTHLLQVETASVVELSPVLKERVSFWSIDPISGRGSVAGAALVRYAATLVKKEVPAKDVVQRISDELLSDGTVENVRVAIWKAVWLLMGPLPEEHKRWLEPWENNVEWLRPDVDVSYRLNTLLRDLTAYTFLVSGEEESIKKAGIFISPSRLRRLTGVTLNPVRVHDTICEISACRARRCDPYQCALRISAIWQ